MRPVFPVPAQLLHRSELAHPVVDEGPAPFQGPVAPGSREQPRQLQFDPVLGDRAGGQAYRDPANALELTQERGDREGASGADPLITLMTARTFFVSAESGKDSNSGSETAPWRSIQQAGDHQLQAGDVVIVKAGRYEAPYFGEKAVVGTAKRPIVFMADPAAAPGTVVIASKNTSKDGHEGFTLRAGCDYVHIVGFNISNKTTDGQPPGNISLSGIFLEGTRGNEIAGNTIEGIINGSGGIVVHNVTDVLIQENTITGTTTEGKSTRGHGINISGPSTGVRVYYNVIRGNGFTGIMADGDEVSEINRGSVEEVEIFYNIIANNGQNGINADGLRRSRIKGNLIYGNERDGVVLYNIDALPSSDNVIDNNTIDQPNGRAITIGKGGGNIDNIAFNNILIGGTSGSDTELILGPNITELSPGLFIDRDAGDYRLSPTGPGFGTGIPEFKGVAASIDVDGNPHIGAFAFRRDKPVPRRIWPPRPSEGLSRIQ